MKKLIVSSSSLRNAMKTAIKVVNKKSVLPILECFKCEVRIMNNSATLHVFATDLETHILVSVACEANEEFKFILPASELAFVEKLSDQPLTIEVDDSTQTIKIHTESETVKATGEKVDDFPILPNSPCKFLGYVSSEFFVEIKTALKYVSTDTRFSKTQYLGVGIETTKEGLTVCATDATMMRITNLTAQAEGDAIGEKFVMNPTFCKLIATFKKADEIHLALMKKKDRCHTVLSFRIDNMAVSIVSQNLDCQLVDYKRVIPGEWNTQVNLDKQDLKNRIEKAMLYSDQTNYQGAFSINGKVILTANEFDKGKEYTTQMPHIKKEGQDIEIGLNLSCLKKILSDVQNAVVNFELTTPFRAIVIKEDNSITLLMPIQLRA